MTANR